MANPLFHSELKHVDTARLQAALRNDISRLLALVVPGYSRRPSTTPRGATLPEAWCGLSSLFVAGSELCYLHVLWPHLWTLVLCRGELYPVETDNRICEELSTGDDVEVDMESDVLTVKRSGKQYNLKPLGEVCVHTCADGETCCLLVDILAFVGLRADDVWFVLFDCCLVHLLPWRSAHSSHFVCAWPISFSIKQSAEQSIKLLINMSLNQ